MKKTKIENNNFALLTWISLFIGIYIISNVIALKPINIFTTSIPASILTSPILFIISNIVQVKYGAKTTRNMILIGAMVLIMIIPIVILTIFLPNDTTIQGKAFNTLFKTNYIIPIISIFAYLISQIANMKLYKAYRDENIDRVTAYIISIAIAIFLEIAVFHGMSVLLLEKVTFNFQAIFEQFIVEIVLIANFLPIFYILTKPKPKEAPIIKKIND